MAQQPGKKHGQKVSIGYAWYALFVLFGINLFNYLDRLSIGPALEHIKRDFSVTDTQIGLIAFAFMLTYAVLSVPMGFLSDRTRRTALVGLGALVWSISTTISGFARHFWGFFFARAAVGSGEGIYAPSGTAIVADYFPKSMRTTAIAIFMSAMIVGGALAYIVAGLILKKTDRFNVPRVTAVLLDKDQKQLNGWNVLPTEETKDRLVRFTFKNSDGLEITALFNRLKESKPADLHSKLFNVSYTLNGKPVTPSAPPEAAAFVRLLNTRILQRETAGLEQVRASLEKMPHNVTIPDKYAGVLSYDPNGKCEPFLEGFKGITGAIGRKAEGKKEYWGCLIYKGIMSDKDKLELQKLSDSEPFVKALGAIRAEAENYHLRSDNWRWIFWILGPPGLIFALLAFLLREPLKGGTEEFLTEEEAQRVDAAAQINYLTLIRTPSVVIMVISNILATYCVGALNIWLFPFVERYKGIKSADAALQFGPIVVGFAVLGVIVSGILADKLQKRTPYGNNIVIVLSILCGTPFMYIFLNAKSNFSMIASIALCIFFLTWINGPQNSLLMSLVEPRLRAMLNGIHILLIHILGDALSPLIVGYYSDKYSLKYALAMLPVFLILGGIGFGIAAIFVPRDLKRMENRMKSIASGGSDAKPAQ